MKKIRFFLCGYHWVGCRVLEHILQRADIAETAVFTHKAPEDVPDLVKKASECGVWCTTGSVNSAEWPFEPDIIASVYYREIIQPHVVGRVHGRIFNLHPALLPRHRGCSSLTWAIIEGDPITGVTFHYIDSGVDTGKVILQAELVISPSETQATLYQKAMELGAANWPAAFELVKVGYPGIPQQGEASFHKRETPFGGEINPEWPLEQVERFIRAMTNPPFPYAKYRGREVKSLEDYLRLRNGE